MPKLRLGLVGLIAAVFMLLMLLIRIMLVAVTPGDAGLTGVLLLKAVGIGFVFDLATVSYALIPLAIYLLIMPLRITTHRYHAWLVRIAFFVFMAALFFDVAAEYLFFDEFGTRFNFIAVDYLIYTQEVVSNIRESYPLPLILSAIAVSALLATVLLRHQLDRAAVSTFSGAYHRAGALLMLAPLLAVSFINIGQTGISTNSFANELAGNGIYNLVAAFRNNELSFSRFYRTDPQEQVLLRLRSLVAENNNRFIDPSGGRFTRRISSDKPEKRLNLVVVVEESLSAEFLGSYGNKDNLTPNLDQLAGQSLRFTNLYATGTRTVRGLEALALSIPPLPGTSIVKRPKNGGFRSWGEVLGGKGYDAKFIYAGYGYFDNMNAFFAGNGFKIVDRADFSKEEISFANAWGVCDEDLFRKVIREAGASHAAGKPFFSMVMTTSNHRPYSYPDGKIDIPSKTGRRGGVKYADYAIGRFIAEASREAWFKDTIFVFVADHCASSAGKTDIPVKKYEIPMLVYAPQHIKPGVADRLMSQIDVAPTVLGLMNQSYDSDFLGRDLFRDSVNPPRAFISTYQKLGYLTEDRLIVLGPRKYAAQYQANRLTGKLVAIKLESELLSDMLAYYQGADYIYQKRLNRLK
jgi:phosphoglycerol transferase MdoB-like AlkP superfamily enzyme